MIIKRIYLWIRALIQKKLIFFVLKPKMKPANIIKLGDNYGLWSIAYTENINFNIVYSFGVGEDISFDRQILAKFNGKVFGFDPTPKSISYIKKTDLPEGFIFLPLGISDKNGKETLYLPLNTNFVSGSLLPKHNGQSSILVNVNNLLSIMNNLGHSSIDILKLDIEGAEYKVIENIITTKIYPSQILVEFHHDFQNFNFIDTINSVNKLILYGYSLVHISKNGHEMTFIQSNEL